MRHQMAQRVGLEVSVSSASAAPDRVACEVHLVAFVPDCGAVCEHCLRGRRSPSVLAAHPLL